MERIVAKGGGGEERRKKKEETYEKRLGNCGLDSSRGKVAPRRRRIKRKRGEAV